MTTRARASREDELTRNRALEGEYSFPRDPADRFISVLAIVMRDQDELAQQFLKAPCQGSLLDAGKERDLEAEVIDWERKRFGRQLEPAAHGILMIAVKEARKSKPPAKG